MPDAAVSVELDVLTLNVWGLPWPLSRQRGARFQRILDHLDQGLHHLVGLQELWGGTHRMLDRLGLARAQSSQDSGLALGGDLAPEDRPGTRHFRRGGGPDRLKAKGVLDASVQVPGLGALRVLVTHLQAGARHGGVRAHQVDELLDMAEAHRGPTLLLGDFNLHAEHAEDERSHQRLRAAGFVDAAEATGTEAPTFESHNPFVRGHRRERFDRVYLRGGHGVQLCATHTAVVDEGPAFSDHHPLRAHIALSREP